MNGDGAFNSQIMVDKLAKLNNLKQSIETLSYWCMFHRKSAKQVVETWNRQFYCSPNDQKVSFLYLANDILQNSRKKGLEFVDEFVKVLPKALNDVLENGDETGRKAVLRLVDIWEDRNVFTVRGKSLKEDFLGKNSDVKVLEYNLNQSSGDTLEKLVLSYSQIYDGGNEDMLFGKCNTVLKSVEEVKKEIGHDLGNISKPRVTDKLEMLHDELKDCVERLKAAESARMTIEYLLREALNEQETKCKELKNLLQVAREKYEQGEKVLNRQTVESQSNQNNAPGPPISPYSETPLLPDNTPTLPSEQNQDNGNTVQPPESFYIPQTSLQSPPFPQLDSVQPLPYPTLPLMGFPPFMAPLNGFGVQGFDPSASGASPGVVTSASEPSTVSSDSAK